LKRQTPSAPTPLQKRGQVYVDRLRGKAPKPERPKLTASGPRIGVALGGGSARGLTHIPYIEAMDEMGVSPSVIAGTSIGALIGAGWANGLSGKELREHAYDVLGDFRMIAGRLWSTQVPGLGAIFRRGFPMQLDGEKVVDAFLPSNFPRTFEELKTPLYVVATDFQSWHQVVFHHGEIRPAVGGSIAIPSLFKPVAHANHLLVDGGVVNPLPLDQVAQDCDISIGIDVNGDPSDALSRTDYNAMDIWFGSAQIMMHSLIAHMIAAYPPDIYLRPHVNMFGTLEFWRVKEIVSVAEGQKDQFKRLLGRKIEDFILNRQKNA